MNRNIVKSILCIFALFFFIAGARAHEGHHHGTQSSAEKFQVAHNKKKEDLKFIGIKYNQNIRAIFNQKCLSCHGESVKLPWYSDLPFASQLIRKDREEAVKHIDMSNGFPFGGHGMNEEDLDAIAKSSSDGSMPPLRYRLLHWGASLNEYEKFQILKWVNESKILLKNSPEASKE